MVHGFPGLGVAAVCLQSAGAVTQCARVAAEPLVSRNKMLCKTSLSEVAADMWLFAFHPQRLLAQGGNVGLVWIRK